LHWLLPPPHPAAVSAADGTSHSLQTDHFERDFPSFEIPVKHHIFNLLLGEA